MKVLLLLLGAIIGVTMGLPSPESCQSMERHLRSSLDSQARRLELQSTSSSLAAACDMDVDSALGVAEFSTCLHRLLPRERKIDFEELKMRVMCFHSFMQEADSDGDLRLDQSEFKNWAAGKTSNRISQRTKQGSDVASLTLQRQIDAAALIPQLISALRALSEGNIPGAIAQVYEILSSSNISVDIGEILALVLQSLNEDNIPEAIGNLYAILSETTDEAEAGLIGLSTKTVRSVATLLQRVIEGSQIDTIRVLIAESVAGVISDFTFLSYDVALNVANVISSVFGDNGLQISDEMYATLIQIVGNVLDLDDDIKASLESLLASIRDGNSSQIILGIFQVLSQIFNIDLTIEDGDQFAATITAVIQAVVEGNPATAIAEIIKLYGLITSGSGSGSSGSGGSGGSGGNGGSGGTGGGSGSGGVVVSITAETRAVLTAVLELLNEGRIGTAISRLNILMITSSEEALSSEARTAIMGVITELNTGNFDTAITQLNLILSSSTEEETISSETLTALTQAVQYINTGNVELALGVITAILNGDNGGSSLGEETRTLLTSISALLASSSQSTAEALAQLNALLLSNGGTVGGVTTSASEALANALQALGAGDSSTARPLLTALLSDTTLNSETKTAIESVIQLLNQNNIASAMTQIYSILTRINNGANSISSQTVSVLRSLLVSISSGEGMLSINQLEFLITSSTSSSTMSAELKILLSAALNSLRTGNRDAAVSQITVVIDIATGQRSGTVAVAAAAAAADATPSTVVTTPTSTASTQRPVDSFIQWLFG